METAKGSKTSENETMGSDTMGSYSMKSARRHTKGFTLIASLLMLLLLSGIAIGLMMMVNTEGKVGGSDLQNNASFRSAEGGIEKMTSDLATVFQNVQSPTAAQICGVGGPAFGGSAANEPAIAGITWKEYQVTPAPGLLGAACPTQAQFTSSVAENWGNVSSGPNQGLYAQIIPINLLATADFPGGQEVSMMRSAQVALIPVFQFGVFSESDLSFFPGPAMDFAGPIHTNGDLYLAGQATVTFHSQLSAYGNVVRTVLANGNSTANNSYTGTIYIPTANSTNACSTTTTSCTAMDAPTASSYGDASVTGGGSTSAQPLSTYNGTNAWYTFSKNTTSHEIINGNYGSTATNDTGTGAVQLSMPFVNGTTHPYEIIRRPSAGESATSALGESREYNLAQIHVLLSDDPADFPGGAQSTDVRLANVTQAMVTANSAWTLSNPYGISIATANTTLGAPSSGSYTLYFAAASNAFPDMTNCLGTYCPSNSAKATPLSSDWPYFPKKWTPPASQALDSNCTLLCPSSATTSAPLSPLSSTTNGPVTTIVPCPPYKVAAASLPPGCPGGAAPVYPYYTVTNAAGTSGTAVTSNATALAAGTTSWNLIDGWLRVEYLNNSNQWVPITNEWLQLGFARGVTPPTAPGPSTNAGSNPINPNAILLLQEPADRNGDGTVDSVGLAPKCTSTTGCSTWDNALPPEVQPDTTTNSPYFGLSTATAQSISMYNWYPINFYDAREGENRDNTLAATDDSCTTNGVMNAVEIDVGNLKRWLASTSGSGPSVNYLNQNGYVLYFSDRRGMLYDPHPPLGGTAAKSGDSGLEDVINAASANGTPDGALETPAANSPEDVNQNGFLDNFGALNLGLGFYNGATNLNTAINTPANPDPFGTAAGSARITTCSSTARKNWVSGARHVLRLVDGSLGNVPLRTDAAATLDSPGGFTVASENPVYILGDYNSNTADSAGWAGDTTAFAGDVTGHAAAAVIADAVTLLSNSWLDAVSMQTGNVTNAGNRNANSVTSYRVAISGGKNRTFPYSSASTWAVYAGEPDIGTDGGVHNFLRFLENWNVAANYKGSLVSLYYSTYNTGFYKCCNTVYDPPTRNYFFDLDFTSPGGLPPGTPMFRDVESLSYRQLFTTRTSSN